MENTGNVDLTNLTLVDTFTVDGEETKLVLPAEAESFDLAKGEVKTFEAQYVVQETDSELLNHVVVSDDDPDTDDPEDEVETPVAENPQWTVEKEVTNTEPVKAGDTVNYKITVENTGNVDIENLTLVDTFMVDGEEVKLVLPEAAKSFDLAKGEVKTFEAQYVVQETDSKLLNHVVVSDDDSDTDDPEDEVETPVEENPLWTVEKEVTNTEPVKVGDTVNYKITVENTGDVDLENLTLVDTFTVDGEEVELELPAEAESFDLAKDEVKTFETQYVVKETDSKLLNHVVVSDDDPDTDDPEDEVETPVDENPLWTVEKEVTNTEPVKVGDTVNYLITVENIGNVDLTNLTLVDTFTVDGEETKLVLPAEAESFELAKGEIKTFDTQYVVKETDRELYNFVIASDNNDDTPDPMDDVETLVDENPALTVNKEVINVGTGENGAFVAGDLVRYRITVTNMGNCALIDLRLMDYFFVNGERTNLKMPAEAECFSLAVGEMTVFDTSYRVEEGDEKLYNIAIVRDERDDVYTPIVDSTDPIAPAVSVPTMGYISNVGDCFD